MNTLQVAQRIETSQSQNALLRPVANVDAASASISKYVATWSKVITAVGTLIADFLLWIAKASIVRSVAPGQRALERHEFESVEARRGGFGNVF